MILIFGSVEAQFDGCSAEATKVYPYVFGSNCTQTNKTNRVNTGNQGLTNVIIENTITDKNLDTYVAIDSDNLCYFNESACSNATVDTIKHYKGIVKVSGSSHTILWGKALTKHSLAETQVTGAFGMALKSEYDNAASKIVVAYVFDYLNNTADVTLGIIPSQTFNQVVIRIFDTSNGNLISTNFVPRTWDISNHYQQSYYINNNRIVYTEAGQIYLTLEHNNKPCPESRVSSNFNYQVVKFYDDDPNKVELITAQISTLNTSTWITDYSQNMGIEGVYYFRNPLSPSGDSSKNIMIWTGFQANGQMSACGCKVGTCPGFYNLDVIFPVFLQISQTQDSSNMDHIIRENGASTKDRRSLAWPNDINYVQIVGFIGKFDDNTDIASQNFQMTIVTQSNYLEFKALYDEFPSFGNDDHSEPHAQIYKCSTNSGTTMVLTCTVDVGYRTLLSGGITIDNARTYADRAKLRRVHVMDGSYTNLFGADKYTSIWLMQVQEMNYPNPVNRPEYVISILDEDGQIRTRWLQQTWEHYSLPYRQSLRYFEHLAQGQEILIFAVNTIPEKGIFDFKDATTTTEHPFAGQQGILMGFDKDGRKTCLGQDTAVFNIFNSAGSPAPNAANGTHNIASKYDHAGSQSHMGHFPLGNSYRAFTNSRKIFTPTRKVIQTPATPITLDAPDAIIEEYNAAPSAGTDYSALTKMMLDDIKIPENGMTAGPQNMTFCLKKHTTYTTADLVEYFRGNLYTDKKAYTASGPSTGLAVKKLDYNNHMKQKLGYVCPEGGCVPSSKFCGFPYLTMQEQELIAMDPFHDVYSNKPYILAYGSLMTIAKMEADILVWNNTHGIHAGGHTDFHGVSRLTIKLKLRDTAQTEIGTFQVLFEYSDPSLGNNLASCANTATHGGVFYLGTQAQIPVLYVDGSNATVGNFTAAFPLHSWPVSCQTKNLQIQMKLLDNSYATLNQGGAITAAKIAQNQFLYHLLQSYDSYQLINITNGQEVNMADSLSYFQNVIDGTLAFQISMNIRKKPATEAPFFYQAILNNPTQSSTDTGQASKPILSHTSNATHTGELTCQKTTSEDQPYWSAQIVGIQLKNFTNDTASANETFLFEVGEKPRVQGIYVYSGVQATKFFSEAEIYLDDHMCGKTPSQMDDGYWYYVSCHQRSGTMIKIKRQTPIADVALSFCGVYAVIAEEEGTAISKGLTFDMNLMNNSVMAFPFSFNMSSTSQKFLDSYNSLYVDEVDQGSSQYNSSFLQKMTISIAPDKWVWGCETNDCSDYIGKQAYDMHGTACQAWEKQSPYTHNFDPLKYFDVNLASNQCRNPVSIHGDTSIKEPFCVTGQGITTSCSREVSFDSTQTTEQPVMIFQCETVNPTEKENLELFTKFYEGMFYFDAESERHIIFQKEENVTTETTVDFHSPNQCITCDIASFPAGSCQFNKSKTSIQYDWKISHLENETFIDDIIITTNTSVGTKILTTTHAFNESFVHYNRTYMEMKFWFNNTFEPVGGYYFEKKFNATICPILCKQRWIKQIEEFSIEIEAAKMDLLYKIELDESEIELCPYYNFSAIIPITLQWETPQLTNITIDPEGPSKVSFYLNQTMFTPDSIHTIVLESFENCFAQVKTLVLQIIVLPVPQLDLIKDGLVVPPDEEYTLDIGKPNTVRLGKYVGDRTDFLYVFFTIDKVTFFNITNTRSELEKAFEVKDNYKKEKLQLKIDLSKMDLSFSRTTIQGTLELTTMAKERTIYEDIKLHLCDPIDEKCPWEGPIPIPVIEEEVEEEEMKKFGVDVEERDAELAAAEAARLALLVKPQISKAIFGPSGDLAIEFNQNIKLINQVYTKNLSTIIQIEMESYEFENTLVGTWVPKPKGETKEKRQLQDKNTIDGFEWYVDDQSDNLFKILTRFKNPQLISRLSEGQDKMEFKILKVGFFKSADNPDLVMDDSKEFSRIQKTMPQYIDKNTAEEIDREMQNGKNVAASSGVVTILITKALGGSMQTIWAMLSVMQDVSFNALIDIKYPAEIERRQVLMMEVAKVDILSLESYWSENWEFRETVALNGKFELYGMETKNFLINSGSLLVNMAGAIFSSLLFHIVLYIARNNAKKSWVFFILKNTVAPPIKLAFIAFLYQFCTDSVICAMLQWKAYNDMGLQGFLSYPGEWLNLIMSILFVCSCFGVTAYGIYHIYYAEDLKNPSFQIKFRSSIDGLDCSNTYKAQFNNMEISRKIFVSCLFIFVENGCIQSQSLLFVSGAYLCYVSVVQPKVDKIGNRLKMNNETVIYLTLMCQFCMANPAISAIMTDTFADLYTLFLAIGILVNISVAAYTTYHTVKNYMKNKKLRKFYIDQNKELKKQLAQKKFDEEIKKQYKDSCMVLKAYEIKDFKAIMDYQGHESNNLVKDYMIEFRQNEQIKKIILARKLEVEEENRQKEEDRVAKNKRRLRIRGYVRRTHATKQQLGLIMEPTNQGQHEDFDKVDYDYDRADGNRVVFKKHYVMKKKAQFGKLQKRKGLTRNTNKLETIKEEDESAPEIKFTQTEQAVNKALDPKIMFQNQWVQRKVHQRRQAEMIKIAANGYKTEDSTPEPKNMKERVQKLVNEPSGHRLQDDKLIELNYHTNKTIINNELVANEDPYFAAAYQQIVKYKVKRLIHYLKIAQKKQYPNQNKD